MPCGCFNPAPTLQVLEGALNIPLSGSLHFGTYIINTPDVKKTYTVRNIGTENLILSDPINVDGSTKFSIDTSFGDLDLYPGESTTFDVALDTTESGVFTSYLYFGTNVSGADPYGFNLTGKVIAPEIEMYDDGISSIVCSGVQETELYSPTYILDGTVIDYGTTLLGCPITKNYRVTNSGEADLTLITPINFTSTDYTLVESYGKVLVRPGQDTRYIIRLNADEVGVFTETVTIESNDPDENPLTFDITGEVVAPELVLTGDAGEIANAGEYDFGETLRGTPVEKTFTITNDGNSHLLACCTTLPEGFLLKRDITTNVIQPGGGIAEFVVEMQALEKGQFSGVMRFENNDFDESPFRVMISGLVVSPEIEVYNENNYINHGDEIDFGSTPVGTDVTKEFTIINSGDADLEMVSGALVGGSVFLKDSDPAATVVPGGTTTFSITLEATTDNVGEYNGSVLLPNSDYDEYNFFYTIKGFVIPHPEMNVAIDGANVAIGDTIDFGTTNHKETVDKVVTITNTGPNASLPLHISNYTLVSGVEVIGDLPVSIPVDGTATYILRIGNTVGSIFGNFSFENNDRDENPFTITLCGNVVPKPDIHVIVGSGYVENGQTVPVDFGVIKPEGFKDVLMRIENQGTANLLLNGLTLPDGFESLLKLPLKVTPNKHFDNTLRFNAKYFGHYAGTVSFINNDESPFTFEVEGEVDFDPINSVSNIVYWFDGKSLNAEEGQRVTQWNDISGNSKKFWQSETDWFKPVREGNSLYFDGQDDYFTSDYRISGGDKTLIVVVKPRSIKTQDQLLGIMEDSNDFYIGFEANTNRFVMKCGNSQKSNGYPVLQPNSMYTIILRYKDQYADMFIDGLQVVRSVASSSNTSISSFLLGRVYPGHYMNANIYAVLMYNRALTDTQCVNISRYMEDRFS